MGPPALRMEQAWHEYAGVIDGLGDIIKKSAMIRNETIHAEAYRFLAGQVFITGLKQMSFSDPDFPVLFRSQGIGYKWGFSNPDTYYISAVIAEDREYRLYGKLGSCNQTIIGTYSGGTMDARAGERVTQNEIVADKKGNFELFIGKTRRKGNWIKPVKGAETLAIYQVFCDWDRETKGRFSIECTGRGGSGPAPLNCDAVAGRLRSNARELESKVKSWVGIGKKLSLIPANSTTRPREIKLAHKDTFFTTGKWRIQNDEALVVEVRSPKNCNYWGWCMYTPWSEALDYDNYQTSLNNNQAVIDPDNKIRVVICGKDPGVPNWLDCAGHPEGFFAWRATTREKPDRPRTRLIKLADIRDHIPGSTGKISSDDRRRMIISRQRHIAYRNAP